MGQTQSGELLNEGLEVRHRSSRRDSPTGLETANCHVIERATWQKSVVASGAEVLNLTTARN